jgi:hypothetical protein
MKSLTSDDLADEMAGIAERSEIIAKHDVDQSIADLAILFRKIATLTSTDVVLSKRGANICSLKSMNNLLRRQY